MKLRTLAGISAALFAGLAALGAVPGKTETTEQESVYAELAKAPEKYRNRVNPLASDPDAAAAGRVLFEEHCEDCHGQQATGGKKAPSLRAKEVQEATPGTIFWILTNGVVRKKMPVWSKLPEPQRWQLVSYIKSLGPQETSGSKSAEKH
jgi:mono/diheme cytochrome c family protein